jgi:hypothetical protein
MRIVTVTRVNFSLLLGQGCALEEVKLLPPNRTVDQDVLLEAFQRWIRRRRARAIEKALRAKLFRNSNQQAFSEVSIRQFSYKNNNYNIYYVKYNAHT